MKFRAVFKKIIEIGPTVPGILHLKEEKLSKFHDFFQIFFYFHRKIDFWPQNEEKNIWAYAVFDSKAENHIRFFLWPLVFDRWLIL